MSGIPAGTELARPFMPAKDFDLSKRFYEVLGFEKTLDSEVAIFNAGSGGFILQRHFQEDWAGKLMMQLMVDDLDAWWAHIESLELSKQFGVLPPKAPAMQPWGLRVAYVVDPSGSFGALRSGVKTRSRINEHESQTPNKLLQPTCEHARG